MVHTNSAPLCVGSCQSLRNLFNPVDMPKKYLCKSAKSIEASQGGVEWMNRRGQLMRTLYAASG
ncbi:hypothetical protein HHE06_02080 [Helicobacter heilmannii]|nr:hypothetical protein HHE06_02080 [Helicobacter heilmannii]